MTRLQAPTPLAREPMWGGDWASGEHVKREWTDANGINWQESWWLTGGGHERPSYTLFCPHPVAPGHGPYQDTLSASGLNSDEADAAVAKHLRVAHRGLPAGNSDPDLLDLLAAIA